MTWLTETLCAFLVAAAALVPLRSLGAQSCDPFWREIPGIGTESFVFALTTWDPDGAGPRDPVLVVGGTFTEAGGAPANHIATWDPATGEWGALGSGTNSFVWTLATLPSGDLVAGGNFTVAGAEAATKIARWDGEQWHAMGRGLPGGVSHREYPFPGVYALTISPESELVAGGNFDEPGISNLAKWDGDTWQPLAAGAGAGVNGVVQALLFMDSGDLVVGGHILSAGVPGTEGIARWDGKAWNSFGQGLPIAFIGGYANAFALAKGPGGDLIAGGVFQLPGGGDSIDAIARWDGAEWRKLGKGLENWTLIAVEAILPQSDGSVIVGGWFDHAGGKPALGLARWDGEEWSDLPGAHAIAQALAALPSGDIAVGGQIGTSGAHLAIWACRGCYADCDGSGSLEFFDFLCFQNLFAAADPQADCDGSGGLDFFDFLCFQNAFAAGCE